MKDPILYKILRPIGSCLFKIVYKPTYIGLENIPQGRLVIAGNHTNNLDCLLLIASTKKCIHFMGKHTLFTGIKKYLFQGMGVIPVNRTIKDKQCLIEARKILENEKTIGIFPEGTINRTKDIIMPFKIGAVKLAFDTDSYIIPFSITGKYIPFKKSITLEYGMPYQIEGNDLDKEKEKLENIITELLTKNGENK